MTWNIAAPGPDKPTRSPADPDPHRPPEPMRPNPTREPVPPPEDQPEPKIEPPPGTAMQMGLKMLRNAR